jgi:hypothetical protein
MKRLAILTLLAVVGISTLSGAPTSAQSDPASSAPIQVLNFQYSREVLDASNEGSGQPPGAMVTFKNITSKTIHSVTFALQDSTGYELGSVSRHGTFSPGVSITRYFGSIRLKDKHGDPIKATPIEVGFVDGSSWSATQ